MQAVMKLPSNGGQLSRVIPEVLPQQASINEEVHTPIYNDRTPKARAKKLTTNSLEWGNTEKALLNFNNQIKLDMKKSDKHVEKEEEPNI